LSFGGVDASNLGIDLDGHDFKPVFENDEPSPRTDIFHMVESTKVFLRLLFALP